jgi:hypothetical protein
VAPTTEDTKVLLDARTTPTNYCTYPSPPKEILLLLYKRISISFVYQSFLCVIIMQHVVCVGKKGLSISLVSTYATCVLVFPQTVLESLSPLCVSILAEVYIVVMVTLSAPSSWSESALVAMALCMRSSCLHIQRSTCT